MNQKAASVSISGIDTKEFETVRAVVSLEEGIADTEEKFRGNVEILDCGVEIPDYKVKKLEYDTVNIALCCDNSGSMEGEKIENLKKAVSTFVGKLADEVNIGIVPFGSGVLEGVCEREAAGRNWSSLWSLSVLTAEPIYTVESNIHFRCWQKKKMP